MIYDSISNAHQYLGMSENLDIALKLMQSIKGDALAPGRYEAQGDQVYYSKIESTLKPLSETIWEVHRRYLDIHVSLSGNETILHCPADQVREWDDYDEARDIQFSSAKGKGVELVMPKGMFAVFFPEDAHCPLIGVGATEKIILKVKVAQE